MDTAVAAGSFTTLAAALTKAGLVDALKGAGPFTVFAPTDAAFEEALKALGITAEQLLARDDLADILKYHVVGGAKVMSTDLKAGEQKVGSLEGSELTVTVAGGKVMVNDASVTAADVDASNGVIHVIDKVLLPASGPGDIVDTAVAAGSFTTLAAALTKAGLVDALKGAGPFTVFAPTDAAFEEALKALGITAEQLLARDDLADILKYHVVGGAKVMSTDLKAGEQKVGSLEGSELTVTVAGGKVMVNDASVRTADVAASNGVIHVIDKVLLPQ